MRRNARALPQRVSNTAVAAALTVVQHLGADTPAYTSKAVSNWQTRLNTPAVTPIPAFIAGIEGSTKGLSSQAMYTAALQTLIGKKPRVDIYISNVLPYINRLNEGWSQQAAAGFVQSAVMMGRKRVKRAKLYL